MDLSQPGLTPGQRYRLVNIPMLVGVEEDVTTTEGEPCHHRPSCPCSCRRCSHGHSRRYQPYRLPAEGDCFTAVPLIPQNANLTVPTTTRCPRCHGERSQSPDRRKTSTTTKRNEETMPRQQEESNGQAGERASTAARLVELLRGSGNRLSSATPSQAASVQPPVTTTIPVETEAMKDGKEDAKEGGKDNRNKATDGGFLVTVDVDKYQVDDLQIHLDGKQLKVMGKRYETLDEDGWQVTRLKLLSHSFGVPETADVDKLTSSLSADGKTLTIEAPLKPGMKKEGVRTIEIVREGEGGESNETETLDKQADSTAAANHEEKGSLDNKEQEKQ